MLFSSISFLYYFLPCTLLCYFAAPKRMKTAVLLLASLLFYAWGEPKYIFLMLGTIAGGYIFGLLIEKYRDRAAGRAFTALSAVFGLGLLAYFKYADFFIDSFSAATGISIPLLNISLPIGISFYTFQMLSYTIDVSRGETRAQRDPVKLAAYISMFPQLIAGPIVRYSDIEKQLESREHSLSDAAAGVQRFICGLGKKVLIANLLAEPCAAFLETAQPSVLYVWLYAVCFTMQIYYDFSGYSDMAIGLGLIFGFHFPENFNFPYISRSITEFWRRWHMTLGIWFRDYLYIPLGGNRVPKLRWFFNILVVWMATGLWHGAAWNFVIWGLYFAVLLVVEKLWLLKRLEKAGFLANLYTMLLVTVGFVVFNAQDMAQAAGQLAGMLGLGGLPAVSAEAVFEVKSYAVVLLASFAGGTPLLKRAAASARGGWRTAADAARPVVLLVILLLSTASLVNGSFNPFLYFRF